jgi:hypothetical protein
MVAVRASLVITDRDLAFAELERAGVISRTESTDTNGNVIWRFIGFPAGAEGEALKVVFDRYIQGRDGQRER